jgi:hypothetical protein
MKTIYTNSKIYKFKKIDTIFEGATNTNPECQYFFGERKKQTIFIFKSNNQTYVSYCFLHYEYAERDNRELLKGNIQDCIDFLNNKLSFASSDGLKLLITDAINSLTHN